VTAGHILGIAAHPDDIEFMMAGTLARLNDLGWKVFMATMGRGDCGSAEHDRETITRIRMEESAKAAALLDSPFKCAMLDDVRLFADDKTVMRATELIRWAKPDILVTQPPGDYMGDHEETSKIVRHAAFAAPMPNYETDAEDPLPPVHKVPHLYYTDPMGLKDIFGRAVKPQFVIDITSTVEKKAEMLKCHASQREWLLKHHGVDQYILEMRHMSGERGKLIGVDFGEGFTQHLGHGYPQDNLLAELLDGKTIQ